MSNITKPLFQPLAQPLATDLTTSVGGGGGSGPTPYPNDGSCTAWWNASLGGFNDLVGTLNASPQAGLTTTPDTDMGGQLSWLFNGTSQYFTVPSSPIVSLTSTTTLTWWARSTDGTGYQSHIEKRQGTDSTGWHTYHDSPISGIWDLWANSSNRRKTLAISTNWIAYALVVVPNVTPIFYANGVSLGAGSQAEATSNTADLIVGWRTQTNSFVNASMDDIRFYNRALTPSEIAELATSRTKQG